MYYFGITQDKSGTIIHRFYLYDCENNMMYCGEDIIKDIAFPSTFNYFKKINKTFFPISKDKFNLFLSLNWQFIENSNFLDFVKIHQIEEWVV